MDTPPYVRFEYMVRLVDYIMGKYDCDIRMAIKYLADNGIYDNLTCDGEYWKNDIATIIYDIDKSRIMGDNIEILNNLKASEISANCVDLIYIIARKNQS